MRYLILSDIHANLAALRAVVSAAAGQYDEVCSCGDFVGYGPDPNAVIDWSREHCTHFVRGNHDKACTGEADLSWFNEVARVSAMWTHEQLTAENLQWLAALPEGPVERDGFALVHGSPADEDEYVVSTADARQFTASLPAAVTFFGHTHIQGGFELHRNGVRPLAVESVHVNDTSGWLMNPGSVGQPRDGDPHSAWAIYDTDLRTVEFRRTPYDVQATHDRIVHAGLPEVLGLRLYRGV